MSATILSDKERKARKSHSCDYCGCEIPVGKKYNCASLIYDNRLYDWKAHLDCQFIAQALWSWIDPDDYGLDSEHFQESVQEFCAAYVCPNCVHWDGEDCKTGNNYCLSKVCAILRTHSMRRIKKDGHWTYDWELVPRTEAANANP